MKTSTYSREYKALLKSLRQARVKAEITQAELAVKLSRPQSFVSKFERGERRLDVVEFLEVAEALGVDAAALFREFLDRTHAKRASEP